MGIAGANSIVGAFGLGGTLVGIGIGALATGDDQHQTRYCDVGAKLSLDPLQINTLRFCSERHSALESRAVSQYGICIKFPTRSYFSARFRTTLSICLTFPLAAEYGVTLTHHPCGMAKTIPLCDYTVRTFSQPVRSCPIRPDWQKFRKSRLPKYVKVIGLRGRHAAQLSLFPQMHEAGSYQRLMRRPLQSNVPRMRRMQRHIPF